ncbi:hypothetical protein VTH06DRAFT_5707 [Thermothelomyces fergusii]
MVRRKMTA